MKFIVFAAAFILSDISLKAQSSSAFEASDVYMHLDKTVYINNENIWFAGYFLNSGFDTLDRYALYVALIDPVMKKVVASDRFMMSEGMSKGNLFLADSLAPGEYSLVAYTNAFLRGYPERPFIGNITLRGPGQRSFSRGGSSSADTLIRISYYPEGGSLIRDRVCRMEVQVLGNVIGAHAYHGVLLSGNDSINEFVSDDFGRGTIYFRPQQDGHYHIRLDSLDPATKVVQVFPPVIASGYSLHLINRIGDSLRLGVYSSEKRTDCFLRVEKGNLPLYWGKIAFDGEGVLINLNTRGFPPGIATLSLLDKDSLVVARRDLFIQEPRMRCSISFDSVSYHVRGKVKAHLHIEDPEGKGVKASFSLSAVYGRRLDALRFVSLCGEEAGTGRGVGAALRSGTGSGTGSRAGGSTEGRAHIDEARSVKAEAAMDRALLINSWDRFDTVRRGWGHEDDYGWVLRSGKKIKRREQILLTGAGLGTGPGMGMVSTDSAGNFELPHQLLSAKTDAKVNLSLAGKEWSNERIFLANGYDTLNRELAFTIRPARFVARNGDPSGAGDGRTGDGRTGEGGAEEGGADEAGGLLPAVRLLQTVTVKAQKRVDFDMSIRTNIAEFQSTTCADWVCMFNVLDCPAHRFGEEPVEGEMYYYWDKEKRQVTTVIYRGCKTKKEGSAVIEKVKGIHPGRVFYAADYQKFNPADPENNTTLYWAPVNATDENGDMDFSFYTNDITGKFTIVVEGVTEWGGVSARESFWVKP